MLVLPALAATVAEIIAAVTASLLVLIPVVSTFVLSLLNRRDQQRAAELSRIRGEKAKAASQASAAAVQNVHVLVNEKHMVALRDISALTARIAELTGGKPVDVALAKHAAGQVESHAAESGVSAGVAATAAEAAKKDAGCP